MNNEPTEQPTTEAALASNEPAALQVCARWIHEHGDYADWSPETHEAYENAMKLMSGAAL